MAINIDECFANIIGISRTECACYSGMDDSIILSDSGLYLDELEAFPFDAVAAAADCHSGNLWDIMRVARFEAIESFKTDLLSCIQIETRLKRPPFIGAIGDMKKASKYFSLLNNYHGIRLNMSDISGGFAKLKRIGLYFDKSETFDIDIYNNLSDVIVSTISVTSVAGIVTWIDISPVLELDMDNNYGRGGLEYYFLYSPQNNMKARNLQIHCGCGGYYKPDWNLKIPTYDLMGDKGNYGWANFVMATGTRGNVIEDRSAWTCTGETQGLLLDMTFGCDISKTICNGALDYQSNVFATASAHAIRYKAGAIAILKIIATSNINRYSLLDGEMLSTVAKEYQKNYVDRVQSYLCPEIAKPENINTNSDCFACIDPYGMMRGTILS